MRFVENLPRWFLKKHQKNLDAVAQAAHLRDSIHVFRLRYGSDYLLVRAATHIHNGFPKRGWGSTIRDRLCGYW